MKHSIMCILSFMCRNPRIPQLPPIIITGYWVKQASNYLYGISNKTLQIYSQVYEIEPIYLPSSFSWLFLFISIKPIKKRKARGSIMASIHKHLSSSASLSWYVLRLLFFATLLGRCSSRDPIAKHAIQLHKGKVEEKGLGNKGFDFWGPKQCKNLHTLVGTKHRVMQVSTNQFLTE